MPFEIRVEKRLTESKMAGVIVPVASLVLALLLGAGLLLGPAGFFGWRWLHARKARAQAQQDALFLHPTFLGQIASLPKADQEKLLRNLAQAGSRQSTLKL